MPGDKIAISLSITSQSTAPYLYRIGVEQIDGDKDFYENLLVGIDNEYYSEYVSEWTLSNKITTDGNAVSVIDAEVEIIMPAYLGNEYTEKSCNITFKVEAVQGNADVSNGSAAKKVYPVYSQEELDSVLENGVDEDETIVLMQKWNNVRFETESELNFNVKGCNLNDVTVDALNSEISYYVAMTESLDVKAVASHSFYLYGKVNSLGLNQGRVVVEEAAKVEKATVAPAAGQIATLIIKEKSVIKKVDVVSDGSVKIDNEGKIENLSAQGTNVEVVNVTGTIENIQGEINLVPTVTDANALLEAINAGGRVILGADINMNSTITISKDVELDLNGKHIEFSEIQTAILVSAGATLTINDETNEGYIKSTGIASKGSYTINLDKGSKDGPYATLVLNGGQIIQNAKRYMSATIYANAYSVIDINGGTITLDSLENYGYCVYIYSYTASVTVDDATLTNNSTHESSTALYGSGKVEINNSTINSDINLSNNDSQISNSTINGNLGTSTSTACTTIVSNCKINGDFKGSKNPQYGTLVNCTVEGDVYSSAGCIFGGIYKNQFDVSWLEEGKIFSTERNADGYYTLIDMPEGWNAAMLTYEAGETSYFRTFIEAYNKAVADSSTRENATITIIKDCSIGNAFSPYNVNKVVIAEGVTVTLSTGIYLSADSTTERCTFENNGTVISNSSISGSLGGGYLINNGSMTVSYFSAKTANWENNGQIILTDGNSSISSSFTNNGTITATSESIYLEVGVNGKVGGTGAIWSEGSYCWNNTSNSFVANGKVYNSTKNSYYLSLSSAVTAANVNDVLMIWADLTYNTATINKTLTVDLNGHTLSYGNSMDSGIFVVTEGGNLTIKDSTATSQPTLNADGTVNYTSGKVLATFGVCGVMVKTGGTFTLESGTIQANSDNNAIAIAEKHRSSFIGADNAIVNIKGGLVINTKTNDDDRVGNAIVIYGKSDAAAATNGKYAESDPTLNISGGIVWASHGTAIIGNGSLNNTKINISGGRVYSVDFSAIYHPQYGQMTVSGDAVITGVSAVLFKGGELTITGGTLEATNEKLYLPTSAPTSGSYITGDALYIEDNYNRGIVVTIIGGTFTTKAAGAQEYRVLFSGATPAVVNDSREQA